MQDRRGADIVAQAEAVYKGVLAEPVTFGPRAGDLVARLRAQGPPEALVVALRARAWSEHLAQRNAAALALLDEAAALAADHGLDRRRGEVLVSRIAVRQELGRLADAQADADQAMTLLPAEGRAEMLFQQAVLLHNLAQLPATALLYRQVLADPQCPDVLRAKAGNNLAHLECERGRPEMAIVLLNAAERVATAATVRAYVAQTRATAEMHRGRLAESLAAFDVAHERYRTAGLPLGEHHLEYAEALAGLRLLPEALAAARQGVTELPEQEVSLMAAEGHVRVARLSLLAGDLPVARAAAQRGAELLAGQGRPGWSARATVVLSEIAQQQGDPVVGLAGTARELERLGLRGDAVDAHLLAGRLLDDPAALRAAVRLARRAPVLVRLRGRLAAALLEQAEGQPAGVLSSARAGLLDLDRHRRALPTTELRVLASSHGAELGELGLRALAAGGGAPAPARVFAWLERTRAAALAPLEAEPDTGADTELAALRALHGELAAARAAGALEPPGLLARIAQAEGALRRASWSGPGTGAARSTPATTAAAVRAALGESALVEFAVLDGQLLGVVLSGRQTRLVPLGPVAGLAETLDALQFALRRLARPDGPSVSRTAADRSARVALAACADRLLTPLGLDPAAPLVVVPVGELQRVPWSALHDGPLSVAPSARLWLRGPADAPPPAAADPVAAPRVVLVAGPDLPGAPAEVAALGAVHPGAVALLDPGPARSTVVATLEALVGADLVHFACHGRLRSDNPAFSSLQLSDGPLTVHELTRRQQVPRRVVLAACESGAQVGFPGDEALGFVSVLLARGAHGVLASGLLVPDAQALPLMVDAHRALAAGATLADALWSARARIDPDDPEQLTARCAFDAFGAA